MVRDVGKEMNDFNTNVTAIVEVSKLTVIALIRIVFACVLQMILPAAEYDLVYGIIDSTLGVLNLEIVPIIHKASVWCCPGSKF
jgi:hypothetical protein